MTDEADAAGAWAELEAVVAALLRSMEALGFIARYLQPPDFARVMEAAGTPETPLRAARPALEAWTGALEPVAQVLANAADETLGAFDELRAAADIGAVFRALRHGPRAQEALYHLATVLPPVSRFFLDPQARADSELAARLEAARPRPDTGVLHRGNAPGERGGYSMYVPEDYAPDRPWPLVMALHGGSGHGRGFLWSWLASARSHGAILVAPTATGGTWALGGEDTDTPNLRRILDEVRDGWSIDPARLLLTGMSDGGTFTYVSGLEGGSPFTHLAPIAASFHRFLADMADPGRLRDLPIHIVHGALDWMFDVTMARQADRALSAVGARVTYLEVDDLSHTYPREANRLILDWLDRP
jgi:phospholipase/carboxylesterase